MRAETRDFTRGIARFRARDMGRICRASGANPRTPRAAGCSPGARDERERERDQPGIGARTHSCAHCADLNPCVAHISSFVSEVLPRGTAQSAGPSPRAQAITGRIAQTLSDCRHGPGRAIALQTRAGPPRMRAGLLLSPAARVL